MTDIEKIKSFINEGLELASKPPTKIIVEGRVFDVESVFKARVEKLSRALSVAVSAIHSIREFVAENGARGSNSGTCAATAYHNATEALAAIAKEIES